MIDFILITAQSLALVFLAASPIFFAAADR